MTRKKTLEIATPRWAVPIVQAESPRYIGIHGGRGGGKSHFVAEYLIEQAYLRRIFVPCLREVQKTLQHSSKRLIENKIYDYDLSGDWEIQRDVIRGPNGSEFIFQGMQNHTADSVKSLEGADYAWFEEAQRASQRSIDLLTPTIRKPGSCIIFTWNPDLATDPVDVLLRGEHKPPRSVVVNVNYDENPWLTDELRLEMEFARERDIDKYAHIWLGEYRRNSETRVFRNWKVEEFEAPPDAVHRLGADWGFAIDPTVLVRCHIVGRTLYVDYEAYRVGCEITDTPALFMTVPDSEKWPITADSARPETISYMQKHGFPKIFAAVKGPKSIEDGIEWLKSYDIIVHPRCQHVIDELTLYSYKTDDLTGNVLPLLEDKHNHTIDALRYACEGARRAPNNNKVPPKVPALNRFGQSGWLAS